MLSKEVRRQIEKVAADKGLQFSCVCAMFHECERGTDLWEYLGDDADTFLPETNTLLWGDKNDEDEEEEEESEDKDCLYTQTPPNEVIEYLLNQVEDNLKRTLKV